MKNKYLVAGVDSSEFELAVLAVDDDVHINDLFPVTVSLVKFSAMSDAMFVS